LLDCITNRIDIFLRWVTYLCAAVNRDRYERGSEYLKEERRTHWVQFRDKRSAGGTSQNKHSCETVMTSTRFRINRSIAQFGDRICVLDIVRFYYIMIFDCMMN